MQPTDRQLREIRALQANKWGEDKSLIERLSYNDRVQSILSTAISAPYYIVSVPYHALIASAKWVVSSVQSMPGVQVIQKVAKGVFKWTLRPGWNWVVKPAFNEIVKPAFRLIVKPSFNWVVKPAWNWVAVPVLKKAGNLAWNIPGVQFTYNITSIVLSCFAYYTAWQYAVPCYNNYIYPTISWLANTSMGIEIRSHIPGFKETASKVADQAADYLSKKAEVVGEIVKEKVEVAAEVVKDEVKLYVEHTVKPWWEALTPGKVVGYGMDGAHYVTKFAWDVGSSVVRNLTWQEAAIITIYASALFGLTYGSKIIRELLDYYSLKAKEAIGAPKLTMEFRAATVLSWPARMLSKWYASRVPKPVFNSAVQKVIDDISFRATNSLKSGAPLPNVLLEGPPGTGKTMVARAIARDSGCNYIMMNGGDLAQHIARGKHVSEFNELWEWAQNKSKPTVIFIDEADALCKKRSELEKNEKNGQQYIELLNAFLEKTGTESYKTMVILATNRKEKLDAAVLNRMDYKLHVGVPDYHSRVQILKEYFIQFFGEDRTLEESAIKRIAAQSAGLTGRSLQKLVGAIRSALAASPKGRLTGDEIDDKVYQFVMQERDLPETPRSWKPVELVRDTWLFYLPRLLKATREAFKEVILLSMRLSKNPLPEIKALANHTKSRVYQIAHDAKVGAAKINPLLLFE